MFTKEELLVIEEAIKIIKKSIDSYQEKFEKK